ncbi:MAG: VIT domain-containing protein, partial [Bacteroidota bacterium]
PLTVLAVFGIMFMGIGLLALAPHLSLAAAICYRIKLKSTISPELKRKNGVFWSGIIISILIIVALDLPITFTRVGLQMTLSGSKATQIEGVKFLRTFGNKDFLLRSCYVRPGISDLFGIFFSPIEPEHSREIFYLVTGTPFNSVPRPNFNIRNIGLFENFDPDQGGDVVAGSINKLKLFSSRIDGSIDPETALPYLEWTMVFKNHDQFYDHEARAKILLPPGAVVSRLTLWINNEEREAAFAGRGKVKAAYKKVVQSLRDPVLVTTAGPNQVLIQCFPVPRNQGEMKIRIGISAPMVLDGWESALLKLPTFVEHNFSIPIETSHSIWIESKKSLESNLDVLSMEHPRADLFRIKGLISNNEWTSKPVVIRSNRVNNLQIAWTEDPLNPKKQFIIQKIVSRHLSKPKRIILIVDGSKSIEKYKSTIAALLPKLPSEVEFGALIASDEVIEIIKPIQASPEIYRSTGNRLKDNSYQGGQDNLPALIRALELTSGDSENAIIWIHGPQPILLSPIDNLLQYWDRLSEHPAFYDIQTETGPNLVLEKLPPIDKIYYIPRLYHFEKDLELLFTRWNRIHFSLVRQKHTNINLLNPNQKTSSHLARLWCRDQVYRMISPLVNQTKKAVELASSYQIVTPVTGAVVLENESQYKEGGLEPVEPGTVPTIPEPDIWFMIIIALFLIVIILVKSRRRRLCATEQF